MKIVIDARLYSPKYTGIGRYTYELIKYLQELDTQNAYVVFLNPEEFESFNCPNEKWTKKKIDIPHYSLKEQTELYKILKKEQADLVYFPHFNVPVRYKKPFVVTIHDLTLHYYPYKEYSPKWSLKKQIQIWVYRFLMKKTVQHAQHIVAISDNTKKDLQKEYSVSDEKISTILEGVPEHFQKASEEQILAMKKKFEINKSYLLYTGVWRSHKNLLNLISAFYKLIEQGKDLQLVLTGKKDLAYPEIPALIDELGLNERVVLTGFVSEDELISLHSSAEVFVFPSLYEGFGLPPLEAMQFGVPVVSSDRASLPQVCGEAAEYCNPEEPEDITRGVCQVLESTKRSDELIQKGTENLKRFSWKKMAGQILDIFNFVCNNRSQTKFEK
jgi:glycosyltransferase involved in cell wall biosynthesis